MCQPLWFLCLVWYLNGQQIPFSSFSFIGMLGLDYRAVWEGGAGALRALLPQDFIFLPRLLHDFTVPGTRFYVVI